MPTKNMPFRADQVGSLLRPQELAEARKAARETLDEVRQAMNLDYR